MRKRTPTTPTNNAAVYLRVSTQEQVQHGVSLEAQEEKLRAYCTMRGLVPTVSRDEGVSASKALGKRPGGAALLAAVSREEVSHVVALKLDRLFRNTADCLAMTSEWRGKGVTLHLVDMGGSAMDTSSAVGKIFLTMLAGFAEFERNLISERTSAALQYKISQGAKIGGLRPSTVLDDQPTIDRAVRLRTQHKMSLRGIALELQKEGYPTKKGGKWEAMTVRAILRRAGLT